jgi:hypothetical protein
MRLVRSVLAVLVAVAAVGVVAAPPGGALDPPTIVVQVRPAAPVHSQLVELAVSVRRPGGGPPRGGTVTVLVDDVVVGEVAAVRQVGTVVRTRLDAGPHVVRATYSGDATTAPGTSGEVTTTVAPAATTTTVTAGPSPVPSGDAVEVRAVVRPVAPASATRRPTGAVRFQLGDRQVTVPLKANGVASWKVRWLADATYQVTATYLGSTDHLGSTTPTPTPVYVGPVASTIDVDYPYHGGVMFVVGGLPDALRTAPSSSRPAAPASSSGSTWARSCRAGSARAPSATSACRSRRPPPRAARPAPRSAPAPCRPSRGRCRSAGARSC